MGAAPQAGSGWGGALQGRAGREAVAAELGFEQVGEPVPSSLTLGEVAGSLPPRVYELCPWRAWGRVAISLGTFAACLGLIAVSPPALLPFSWFLAGTSFTGFFVVGHDCGHRCFSRNRGLEDIVGTLMMVPLVYPFEPWRIQHNLHHAHTNKLGLDTAWHPIMPESFEASSATVRGLQAALLGSPCKLFASVGHCLEMHFDPRRFTPEQRPRVWVSLAAVAAFIALGWPLIGYYTGGVTGWAKFWLMPWLGYHFWMSAFTLVHHTAPHIPFKSPKEWNACEAQLGGTVHCVFPRWVDFLTHDISVHIPHHVDSRIPSYRLREAHAALHQRWGRYMNITALPKHWRLVLYWCCRECCLYDARRNYQPFPTSRSRRPGRGAPPPAGGGTLASSNAERVAEVSKLINP